MFTLEAVEEGDADGYKTETSAGGHVWYDYLQRRNLARAEGPFTSFNDFFIRQFRPGLRPYPDECGVMGAPAEARYLAFAHVDSPLDLPVKGMRLDPISLLGKTPDKERFRGGPC
ncbi:MAG: hypothetical protein EOO88_12235, partial [Pedobacter sp.]